MALVFLSLRCYFWSWQEAAVQIEIQAEELQAEARARAIRRDRTHVRMARKPAAVAVKAIPA
jgi:hypothetical protein